MIDIKYKVAMKEVLHYLKGINQDDVEKINPKLIEFFQNNSSKDYECKFDYTKPLKELEVKEETKGLIAMICFNYWCETEEEKNRLIRKLKENEKKYQEELSEKFNPNNIFKNKKEENLVKEDIQLVKYEQKNFMQKFFNKIKNNVNKILKIRSKTK